MSQGFQVFFNNVTHQVVIVLFDYSAVLCNSASCHPALQGLLVLGTEVLDVLG